MILKSESLNTKNEEKKQTIHLTWQHSYLLWFQVERAAMKRKHQGRRTSRQITSKAHMCNVEAR